MKCAKLLIAIAFILKGSFADEYVINNKTFPDWFSFGVSTSSYQIEGGWDADGKGPSFWDYFTHKDPSPILDGNNGDIACDSYHKYKTDVAMLKDLGVSHYRFSLSWPRILPSGFPDSINEPGVQYYKNLISELKANNITPLVTLYHSELPLPLFQLNFLLNTSFADWFADYARVCFEQFGDEVQWWATFNEAMYVCESFEVPPGYNEYECGYNLLRGHAKAWHIYDEEFRAKQQGYVSMVHAIAWFEPASNSSEDRDAAARTMEFDLGFWANPIYYGDYPDVVKSRVTDGRLIPFTDEEKAQLKGTSDYFSINSYVSLIAKDRQATPSPTPSRDNDISVDVSLHPNYPDGAWGIRSLTQWIRDRYQDPYIIMTENGMGVDEPNVPLEDDDRISLVRNYLSAIRDTIDDGAKFIGYTLWSLMDNFEWMYGFSRRFGIYEVDFTSENRTRTPRKSAHWYKNVIRTRCLVDSCIE